jgi:hypothetical protein
MVTGMSALQGAIWCAFEVFKIIAEINHWLPLIQFQRKLPKIKEV